MTNTSSADSNIPCSWDGCRLRAITKVYNSDLTESAFVCAFHRRVAAVNLEQYDRVRAPDSSRKMNRPAQPIHIKSTNRPNNEAVDWTKDAAKKADNVARPIDQEKVEPQKRVGNIIKNMPSPRKK